MSEASDILNLEIRAARIAATLDARPALGAIWRRMVGLSEAAASLSLEMITASEADIIRPPLGISTVQGEPQSARTAQAIYTSVLRPGSLRNDPTAVFDRCVEATHMTDAIDDGAGGYVYYPIDVEIEMWNRGRALFADLVPRILKDAPPPIIGAIAIARLASACMPDPHPMTERLIFMAAEHELRRDILMSDPIVSQSLDGLDRRVDASWICPPSLALSRGGLRSWGLDRPLMRSQFIERLHVTLGREIGRLGPLNAWSSRIDAEFTGKNTLSRRADFAALFKETPILDGTTTANALGITKRAARNYLEDAERMGLAEQLTSRASYRIWAVPVLADMIHERGKVSKKSVRVSEHLANETKEQRRPPLADDPDFETRIAQIMGNLDDALTGLDATLEKYKPQHTRP